MTGEDYAELRPLLFSIAYRMTGSVADSEDIVQEALLRHHRAAPGTRDRVRPRLPLGDHGPAGDRPPPLGAGAPGDATSGSGCPSRCSPRASRMSPSSAEHRRLAVAVAFLVMLESLTPVERAVFLLREVFDYDYGEIARIVGQERGQLPPARGARPRPCRGRKPRFEASREQRERLAGRFFAAAGEGDVAALERASGRRRDFYGDGGGKVRGAAANPVYGRDRVVRLMTYFMGGCAPSGCTWSRQR